MVSATTRSNDGSGKSASTHEIQRMDLPYDYKHKGNGIWFLPNKDEGEPIHVVGPINISAQTRDADGSNWGYWVDWPDGDGRQHTWAMPKSLLAGDGGEIRATLLDRGCYVSPSARGRAKLMDLLSTIEVDARALAVEKCGWANESSFVLPNRTIGNNSKERVIYQGPNSFDHAYRSKGNLRGWQSKVARFGLGNSRIAFSIALAFVGPLLPLIGEEGGGFNLRGPSSIGKTTGLLAGASVWGGPDFLRQWRATSNGLEGVCVLHNETFLPLDEIAQLDPRDAVFSAYLMANGMGKARAGRSGALRASASWKVMFLSSGEISISDLAGRDARGTKRSAAGQEVRILDFAADAGAGLGLFENLHDSGSAEAFARRIKEGAASAYGVAGPEFVSRIIADRDAAVSNVKASIATFVAEHVPPGSNGQVARAARRFALVAAAGELAASQGVLPWPPQEVTSACATIFRQWLVGRGGIGAAEDRDAIAKVRGFLEMHGGSRFEAVSADEEIRIINRAGFWRDSDRGREYLFLAETWKSEVCAGMDASRVAKVLATHGLLRQDSQGKNSISVTLPAGVGKSRCYVVNAAIFDFE